MKTHNFFIDCNPPRTTAQASMRIMKRRDGTQFVGKASSSKGKKVQDELLLMLMQNKPSFVLNGPVKLYVEWRYPWRKNEPQKNKVDGFKYCDKRPDADNLCKLFLDCMTRAGFWDDDGQVAILEFTKMWSDRAGIAVIITELE